MLTVLALALLTIFGGLAVRHLFGFRQITAPYLYITRSLYWLFLLLVWQYSVRVERQPLLIWPERRYGFWVYVLSLVVITAAVWMGLVVASLASYVILHKVESSKVFHTMVKVFKVNPVLGIYTAVTAGVTEELVFRGYLLPRLNMLLKSPFWAIAISTLIFGLAHLGYGTIINVAVPFVIGLAQAIYYWQYRNIKVTILFHVCWDLMVILLATMRA